MPPDVASWLPIIGSGGPAALGAMLVWYFIAKHLPRLQSDFKEMLMKQGDEGTIVIKDFLDTLKSERESFREELTEERKSTGRIVDAIERLNQIVLFLAAKKLTPEELRLVEKM